MKLQQAALFVFVALALVFAGCAQQADQQPEPQSTSDAGVAATVNGEDISTQQVQQLQQRLQQQAGSDVSTQQALDVAIQQVLLEQEAQRQGISASREDVEELFEQQMAMQNQTLDDLKEQLGDQYESFIQSYQQQLTVQELINSQEVEAVSDERVREFYDQNPEQFSSGNETLAFEDVEEDIRTFLEQQRQAQVLEQLTAQLREQADITTY